MAQGGRSTLRMNYIGERAMSFESTRKTSTEHAVQKIFSVLAFEDTKMQNDFEENSQRAIAALLIQNKSSSLLLPRIDRSDDVVLSLAI